MGGASDRHRLRRLHDDEEIAAARADALVGTAGAEIIKAVSTACADHVHLIVAMPLAGRLQRIGKALEPAEVQGDAETQTEPPLELESVCAHAVDPRHAPYRLTERRGEVCQPTAYRNGSVVLVRPHFGIGLHDETEAAKVGGSGCQLAQCDGR